MVQPTTGVEAGEAENQATMQRTAPRHRGAEKPHTVKSEKFACGREYLSACTPSFDSCHVWCDSAGLCNQMPAVTAQFVSNGWRPLVPSRWLANTHENQVLFAQLCLTLCGPMDCSLPGSSVHGILQARILEWLAIFFSRVSAPIGI